MTTDLVEDEEDVVLVAQRAHALEILLRVNEHARGAADGLHHDGGDLVGALHEDLLLQHGDRVGRDLVLGRAHLEVELLVGKTDDG